jgi:hypothetical protein
MAGPDDLSVSRRRHEGSGGDAGRLGPPARTPIAGLVVSAVADADPKTTVGGNPVTLGGTGSIGDPVTVTIDPKQTVAVDITRGYVVRGDLLRARPFGRRWVAEGPHAAPGDANCPHTAHITWYSGNYKPADSVAYKVTRQNADGGSSVAVAGSARFAPAIGTFGGAGWAAGVDFTFVPTAAGESYTLEYASPIKVGAIGSLPPPITPPAPVTVKVVLIGAERSYCNVYVDNCPAGVAAVACCGLPTGTAVATVRSRDGLNTLTIPLPAATVRPIGGPPTFAGGVAYVLLPNQPYSTDPGSPPRAPALYDVTIADPGAPAPQSSAATKTGRVSCLASLSPDNDLVSWDLDWTRPVGSKPDLDVSIPDSLTLDDGTGTPVTLNRPGLGNPYQWWGCKVWPGITSGWYKFAAKPYRVPCWVYYQFLDHDCKNPVADGATCDVAMGYLFTGCQLLIYLLGCCTPAGCYPRCNTSCSELMLAVLQSQSPYRPPGPAPFPYWPYCLDQPVALGLSLNPGGGRVEQCYPHFKWTATLAAPFSWCRSNDPITFVDGQFVQVHFANHCQTPLDEDILMPFYGGAADFIIQ